MKILHSVFNKIRKTSYFVFKFGRQTALSSVFLEIWKTSCFVFKFGRQTTLHSVFKQKRKTKGFDSDILTIFEIKIVLWTSI